MSLDKQNPDGEIAYHKLIKWWLSTFSPQEREYMANKYQPYGAGIGGNLNSGRKLVEGRILSSSQTTGCFLWSLSSWFQKTAEDRVLARKILVQAEQASRGNIIDLHHTYGMIIETYYRDRDTDSNAISVVIAACQKQIALAGEYARLWHQRYKNKPLPSVHKGFSQLITIYKKQKNYAGAMAIAQHALAVGWPGNWEKIILECRKKLAE